MYRASLNKYYVDDVYQLVFARGGVLLGNALWWFDAKVIDGIVNGTGWLARTIGGGLRKIQTGRVENYGLGIAAGLAIVLLGCTRRWCADGRLPAPQPRSSSCPRSARCCCCSCRGSAHRAIRWIALLARAREPRSVASSCSATTRPARSSSSARTCRGSTSSGCATRSASTASASCS